MSYSPSNCLFILLITAFAAATIPALVHGTTKTMTHVHFYMHVQNSNPNATATKVVIGSKPIPSLPSINFGDFFVFDVLLTEGLTPDSAPMGRGQGFYPSTAFDKPVFLVVMNVVLTSCEYNGSSIMIMGGDDTFETNRELSVIGGTGRFRMARGYVIWKTVSWNTATRDAVLELDIYATNDII